MRNPLEKVKEIRLIEKMAKGLKAPDKSVVVSIGDDCAVVRASKGSFLLSTVDMLIEGVHFVRGEDYERVGYKAMAVSVSDIAAMGGIPRYALISAGLPEKNVARVAQRLWKGLKKCAKKFGIDIVGGDLNRSDKVVVDCFMIGEVEEKNLVLRSGAKTGDHIFVSGPLGGSLQSRHLTFEPRVDAARFLVKNFKVNAMMDLSDGLGMDLNRLVCASRCGAVILENRIPLNPGLKDARAALYDGEDFELLFTLSPREALRLYGFKSAPTTFYPIGRITDLFRGVKMADKRGRMRDVRGGGFKHFKR